MKPGPIDCPICKEPWFSVADKQSIIDNKQCLSCVDTESMTSPIRVKFGLELSINRKTGETKLISVDGRKLLDK